MEDMNLQNKQKLSNEFRLECLSRHLSEVKKLNDMTFKDAKDHCKKMAKEKGNIAAREIWKSSKHWEGNEKRKNR